MIRRHVLAALAQGIAAGDEDTARRALGEIDWALRGFARRRLEAALLDAALAVGEGPHRLHAAALIIAGKRIDFANPDVVIATYEGLELAAPPRWPIATGVAAASGMLLAMVVAFTMVRVVTAGAANGEFTRPSPPSPGGAFASGGTPIHDAAIEQVLATDLPALEAVRVTDDRKAARVASLRDALAGQSDELASAWRQMIDTYDRWRESGGTNERLSRELHARVAVVSDQFAASGIGYVLDVEVGEDSRRTPGIYAFRVDDVGFVLRNDERVRVLGVRRLDRRDQGAVTVLGMTTSERRDPIVLLDEVDEKVRTQIVPILGGQPYFVGDDYWSRTSRGRKVAIAASEGIRRELHTALGFDADSLAKATLRCQKLVAASVRHHEAQHSFDRARRLPYPAALAAMVNVPANTEFAIRTRYELSGYLSQIASDTWLPQLTLWNLSRHAFRRNVKPVEEAYVAAYVIEGLARHLGIKGTGPAVYRGLIDRDNLAALVLPLSERSTTEIRSAAAALWTESFETRLVRIVDEM